jgi:hypothetical protein
MPKNLRYRPTDGLGDGLRVGKEPKPQMVALAPHDFAVKLAETVDL